MHWLWIVLIASGCGLYEPCEPYIDYRTTMYEPQAPGLEGEGCPSLMFVEEPVPVEWYPESTIAFVRECHDDSLHVRRFRCYAPEWTLLITPR